MREKAEERKSGWKFQHNRVPGNLFSVNANSFHHDGKKPSTEARTRHYMNAEKSNHCNVAVQFARLKAHFLSFQK